MIFHSVNEKGVIQSAALADRMWERVRATPITVANERTIRIAAVGVTNSGEAFANCSSLRLRWELSDCDDLAYWLDIVDSERSQSDWERFLVLQNGSGSVLADFVNLFCYFEVIDFGILFVENQKYRVQAYLIQILCTVFFVRS